MKHGPARGMFHVKRPRTQPQTYLGSGDARVTKRPTGVADLAGLVDVSELKLEAQMRRGESEPLVEPVGIGARGVGGQLHQLAVLAA